MQIILLLPLISIPWFLMLKEYRKYAIVLHFLFYNIGTPSINSDFNF